MQATFVDPMRLETDLGPVVQNISVEEYRRVSENLPAERVTTWLEAAKAKFQIRGVADDALERSARTALGLAQLAVDYRLDVVSLNGLSVEMRSAFNLRPALYPTALDAWIPANVLFHPEGDLGAATASYILHCLSGSPTMLLELWSWDEALNQLFGGHGGMQNPAMAASKQVWITHDYDICHPEGTGGAQFQFIAREGRVTFFQLRSTNKGWQAIAASGMCLEGSPFVEGCSHAIIRLDASVGHFLNKVAEVGATQHWILAYGSVLHELEAFCQMEKIPVEIIKY
jgi:L-fucose isomerase-like protein